MKDIYIEIYSVEMQKTYISGWYSYDADTNLLVILRDLGLEISENETACTVLEEGIKKTAFVQDKRGFRFVCSFRTKVF